MHNDICIYLMIHVSMNDICICCNAIRKDICNDDKINRGNDVCKGRVHWFIHNDMCIIYIHLKIISREKAITVWKQNSIFIVALKIPFWIGGACWTFAAFKEHPNLIIDRRPVSFRKWHLQKHWIIIWSAWFEKVRSSSTGQLHCCYVCSTRTWWRAFRRLECSSEVSSAIRMFIQFLVGHCQVYTIS